MKVFLQARLISLIMCVVYITVFITIVVLNVNGILQPHIYLNRALHTIFDVSFFIPLLLLTAILNLTEEPKWIFVSYFIFIILYVINLAVSFIPVGFRTGVLISTIAGSVITLYSIYIAIIMFFVKHTLLSPAFKLYAWSIIFGLIYTFGVTVVLAYILSPPTFFMASRFTSLAGAIPMLGVFYIIYSSNQLMKYNDFKPA